MLLLHQPGPGALAVADFNGDGLADIAALGLRTNVVEVLLSRKDGTFKQGKQISLNAPVFFLASGDFNNDGNADLAVVSGSGVFTLLGNGDGTFQPPLLDAQASGSSMAVGDFNKDGNLDVLVANSASSDLQLLLGKGDGTDPHLAQSSICWRLRVWPVGVLN